MKFIPNNNQNSIFLSKVLLPLLLLLAGYFYSSPYIAIFLFKSSVEDGKISEAKKYINFPSVRSSFKYQLKSNIDYNLRKNISSEILSEFGYLLLNPVANVFIEKIVDATISPKGLFLLIETGKLSRTDAMGNTLNRDNQDMVEPRINFYYSSFNRFVIATEIQRFSKPIKTIWSREGIFHWKLNSIDMPLEIIN